MSGLALYRAITSLVEPLAPGLLRRRAARGKEELARLNERLGRPTLPRPAGPLVWLHGVSVGESVSLLPLIDRIRAEKPGLTVLVTSGTVTSAQLLAKRLPAGVIHQYAPVDGPRTVARFLDHWKPDTALFAESELWPNLLLAARKRGIKLALVSARITRHSADGWAKRPAAAQTLLGAFDLILPQDAASAERLASLGATVGPELNLKYVAASLPCDEAELKRLKAAIGKRPVLLGASTHPGDEAIIAAATPPGALLILAIRHPERGPAVAAELDGDLRSSGASISQGDSIYIADTLGEMGLWFRLADLVVMGGAFSEGIGGHNPLEPARLNAPAVSGLHAFNFADVYGALAARSAVAVVDKDQLNETVASLMADTATRKAMAKAAATYADEQGHAFNAGWTLIKKVLP
jgi:3-deoxy-D-manno-octulosonic-acid transferase